MSDSPRRLFSWTSKPGSQTPAPTPSECVSTHARPWPSTATMFVVCSPPTRAWRRVPRRVRGRARQRSDPAASACAEAAPGLPRDRRAWRRVAPRTRRRSGRATEDGTRRDPQLPGRRRRPPGALRRAIRGRRSSPLPPPVPRGSRRARAERGSSPSLSVRPSRVKRSAPRSREKSPPSISSVRACISGSGTPDPARAIAGSHSRPHGSRPSRSQSSPRAAGRPGTAHEPAPIA